MVCTEDGTNPQREETISHMYCMRMSTFLLHLITDLYLCNQLNLFFSLPTIISNLFRLSKIGDGMGKQQSRLRKPLWSAAAKGRTRAPCEGCWEGAVVD